MSTHEHQPPNLPPGLEGVQAAAVLSTLAAEPETGVGIFSLGGEIVWANDQFVGIFFGPGAKARDFIGKTIRDLMPADAARERFSAAMRVMVSGRPMMIRALWGGRQIRTWLHSIDSEPGATGRADDPAGKAHFLAISRLVQGDVLPEAGAGPSSFDTFDTDVIDLGPLKVLTSRELQVLALLGQGLAAAEIARVLNRPPGDVDKDGQSIAQKLHAPSRDELAAIAQQAGLTLRDARRTRV